MIEAEQTLWIVNEMLSMIEHSGSFADRIHSVRASVEEIAREMRSYNDQFEDE